MDHVLSRVWDGLHSSCSRFIHWEMTSFVDMLWVCTAFLVRLKDVVSMQSAFTYELGQMNCKLKLALQCNKHCLM